MVVIPSIFCFIDLKRLYRTMRADTDHVEYYSAALVEQQVRIIIYCMIF
jgi:hypothetical protein